VYHESNRTTKLTDSLWDHGQSRDKSQGHNESDERQLELHVVEDMCKVCVKRLEAMLCRLEGSNKIRKPMDLSLLCTKSSVMLIAHIRTCTANVKTLYPETPQASVPSGLFFLPISSHRMPDLEEVHVSVWSMHNAYMVSSLCVRSA
jgi:hypothetical protein